jgi:hypothetical protein
MGKITLLLSFLILMTSCGGLTDASKVLRNEKKATTDEFLVKKKNPLVLPPDYDKIPEPGSLIQNKQNEEETIKKILKVPEKKLKMPNGNLSTEESILKEIRK